MTDSLIYRAAEPSRATRKVVRRSKASLRGSMIAKLPAFQRPRVIHFESMLEYRFLCLMLVQPDVYDIQEQPRAILYRRHDGSQGTHIFDFLVKRTDGSRTAVAIKPLRRVESRNFKSELALVAASVTKDFADRIKLVTDAQLDRHAATKAERQLMRDRPSLTEVAA